MSYMANPNERCRKAPKKASSSKRSKNEGQRSASMYLLEIFDLVLQCHALIKAISNESQIPCITTTFLMQNTHISCEHISSLNFELCIAQATISTKYLSQSRYIIITLYNSKRSYFLIVCILHRIICYFVPSPRHHCLHCL